MSMNGYDDELDDENGDQGSQNGQVLDKRIREQMRRQEREVAQLREENARLRLSTVMDELGIPTSGPGKFFRDNYRGESTREAIQAAATEAQVIGAPGAQSSAPSGTAPTGNNQDEVARLEAELARLRNGSQSVSDSGADQEVSLQEAIRLLQSAKSPEEFDDILGSDRIQRLKNQPISFA